MDMDKFTICFDVPLYGFSSMNCLITSKGEALLSLVIVLLWITFHTSLWMLCVLSNHSDNASSLDVELSLLLDIQKQNKNTLPSYLETQNVGILYLSFYGYSRSTKHPFSSVILYLLFCLVALSWAVFLADGR